MRHDYRRNYADCEKCQQLIAQGVDRAMLDNLHKMKQQKVMGESV